MNDKTFRALEYDKILSKIAHFAATEKAKSDIMEIRPYDDINLIRQYLDETEEADIILHEYAVNPTLNFDDVTTPLDRAEVMSMLSLGEILRVERVLRVARTLRGQILNVPDDRIEKLKEKANTIYTNKKLEDDINAAILSDTEVSDNASPELRSIRIKMRKISEGIKAKLNNFVNSVTYSKYIQDNIITIRNDRYVIPLKAEYKGAIPGLIHDQSSSGATLYVEPMVIVEMNNDLTSPLSPVLSPLPWPTPSLTR